MARAVLRRGESDGCEIEGLVGGEGSGGRGVDEEVWPRMLRRRVGKHGGFAGSILTREIHEGVLLIRERIG